MKRILYMILRRCRECPFYEWQENEGMSNSAGSSHCRRAYRLIESNVEDPEIPKWCPLPTKEVKLG